MVGNPGGSVNLKIPKLQECVRDEEEKELGVYLLGIRLGCADDGY
jgi:hypothetical protein